MPIKKNLLAKIPFPLKLRFKKMLAKSGNRNESLPAAQQKSVEIQFQAIVFHDSLPKFDRDSGSLRLFEILKILVRCGRVVFVPLYGKRDEFYDHRRCRRICIRSCARLSIGGILAAAFG